MLSCTVITSLATYLQKYKWNNDSWFFWSFLYLVWSLLGKESKKADSFVFPNTAGSPLYATLWLQKNQTANELKTDIISSLL